MEENMLLYEKLIRENEELRIRNMDLQNKNDSLEKQTKYLQQLVDKILKYKESEEK